MCDYLITWVPLQTKNSILLLSSTMVLGLKLNLYEGFSFIRYDYKVYPRSHSDDMSLYLWYINRKGEKVCWQRSLEEGMSEKNV